MKQHIPSVLIISYLSRLMVTGASIGDAIVIIALSAVYSGYCWLEHSKKAAPNAELINKVNELDKELKLTKDKMNSLSLASTFKR